MTKRTKLILFALLVKKLIFFTLVFSSTADAAALSLPPPLPVPALPPVAAGFQTFGPGIPLAEFLRITLSDMSHRAYVLAPSAASDAQSVISADFSRVKLKDPLPLVREVLDGAGFTMREVSGVLLIEKKKATAEKSAASLDTYVYRPRHRAVGSLSSYFNLFPDLTFSFSAGIAVRAASATNAAGASSSAPAGSLSSSMDSGATTFSAQDKDPSFLVVQGSSKDIERFKAFLAQVDVVVPEVLLRAYVFEVRDTSSKDSAVQLVASLLGGRMGVTLGAGASSSSGDSLRLSLPNFSLAVSALTGDSRVRLVSSPTLRAADGTTASAAVGTDTPTLGAIVTQSGSTQQSVTYQSAGVLLSISPRVLADSIRLTISQELSSFVKTETGLDTTPTKLRRSFKSDVVARDGEVVLLGGLSEAQNSEASRGSFSLFNSRSKAVSSSEIVVLLKVERL